MKQVNFDKIKSIIYSEKSNRMLQENKYVFVVSKDSNKKSISSIISKAYNIIVCDVNIINVDPKKKRFRGAVGTKSGYKKAIVTVEKGKTINFNN